MPRSISLILQLQKECNHSHSLFKIISSAMQLQFRKRATSILINNKILKESLNRKSSKLITFNHRRVLNKIFQISSHQTNFHHYRHLSRSMISAALIKTHSKLLSPLIRNSQSLNNFNHHSLNRFFSGEMMQNHNPHKILTCKTILWTLLLYKISLTKQHQQFPSLYQFLTLGFKVQQTPLNGRKRRKRFPFKKLR